MSFSDFLLVELTWVNQAFYLSVALGDRSVFLSTTSVVGKPILGLVCQFARQTGKCQVGKPWQTINTS